MPTGSPADGGGSLPVGIVLAGGASRRFGSDKATLEIARGDGVETLAGWALRRLREVCEEVAVADGGRDVLAGVRSLPDGPGRGPAAGLLGAARAFPARSLLVLACDLPAVPVELLAKIAAVAAGGDFDLVLPRWEGGAEPLSALYAPKALAALDRRVAAANYALYDLAESPGLNVAALLSEADLLPFGPPEEIFANVNTPEDLARWLARRERD
ncbi:MAG TPA: molybdenum cofactor guanylyltransferase [Thermoanaerobaculia bacterium]|nr:molybdenum cofactor guanylyltransferase [Thermoanaerobaculia bacterium]